MNCGKLFLVCLLVYPFLHYTCIQILVDLHYSVFGLLEQPSEDHGLVFDCSLVEQCDIVIVHDVPNLKTLRSLRNGLVQLLNLTLLIVEPLLLKGTQFDSRGLTTL